MSVLSGLINEMTNNQIKLKLHFQRFEFKYQVPLRLAAGIIPEFLKYMEWDPFAKNLPDKSYAVQSLYYDSAGLGCYYQKISGEKNRKKIRIRFYNDDLKSETPVFLEIKRKFDAVVVKDRLPLNYKQCDDLLRNNKTIDLPADENRQATINEFLWLKNYNGMMPQNLVIYKRKPLISKIDPNFRVTVDYDLKTCLAEWLDSKRELKPVCPEVAVIEIKFNNILPFWFHQIIRRYNLEQKPFSKYCHSLEVCRPEIAHKNLAEIYQPQLAGDY
ncbi:MAG: hypothetical protein A3J65_04385 [Candidatus Buchananbacteria bacterium RIFCSPHIGHO2_02_FULL_45_11b]|uniref:VTC domain-containing protein n=1 Tax=Candidatus Buchananbacteria bacterium RIFCSPHIGHO2_02_FULL_45_11b TaxID=1797541 RepID=A0A1G1YES7_9BACT|nr:MAG: hypothetical protein A3J65_04385 [Candidatus Buchananbacteria bacterium RIFCSPHIGHO2_02_FULL_45_11b]